MFESYVNTYQGIKQYTNSGNIFQCLSSQQNLNHFPAHSWNVSMFTILSLAQMHSS